MRDAVRRYGCVFQTGTQQRSDPKFRNACELARNGYLGKVHTVYVGAPGGRSYPVEPPCDPPDGFDRKTNQSLGANIWDDIDYAR